jgi:signal transduction histidine kinase
VPTSGLSKAWAAVPIQLGGAASGALLWTYDRAHHFGEEERALMHAVARQCSLALERARSQDAERRARRDAELARERADEANRAKTEFLAVMSHELRTPLNAISGYAELLDVGVHGPLSDMQHDAIARIQRNQRHLLGLINDVLNFARIEAGQVSIELRPVRISETVAAIEALVGPQLAVKGHRYRCEVSDPSLVAHADEERLRQILLNLISNAIKFTPGGGEIRVGCAGQASRVSISVSDSGPGIPADKLDRIFEPFVQLESGRTRTHDGAGLGLAISRDLARAMGGDISVESALGAGTTFVLTLPSAVEVR